MNFVSTERTTSTDQVVTDRDQSIRPGDRVAGLTMLCGAMAEVVTLPPECLFRLPDSVSFEAGAGVLFNDLTVHFALRTRGRLSNGDTVLVHGAAGVGQTVSRLDAAQRSVSASSGAISSPSSTPEARRRPAGRRSRSRRGRR